MPINYLIPTIFILATYILPITFSVKQHKESRDTSRRHGERMPEVGEDPAGFYITKVNLEPFPAVIERIIVVTHCYIPGQILQNKLFKTTLHSDDPKFRHERLLLEEFSFLLQGLLYLTTRFVVLYTHLHFSSNCSSFILSTPH